jgi:hypothetical protein
MRCDALGYNFMHAIKIHNSLFENTVSTIKMEEEKKKKKKRK